MTDTDGLTRLPHTGLQVPRLTLRVTEVEETGDGAVSAYLVDDDFIRLGVVRRDSHDSVTVLKTSTSVRRDVFAEFAAACRDEGGGKVDPADVLDDLIEEALVTKLVDGYADRGRTACRLIGQGEDGEYPHRYAAVAILPDDNPFDADELRAIAKALARQHTAGAGERWEVWSPPAGWVRLPVLDAADNVAVTNKPADQPGHKLTVIPDDKYKHLAWGVCSCGRWKTCGAYNPEHVSLDHAKHVDELVAAAA